MPPTTDSSDTSDTLLELDTNLPQTVFVRYLGRDAAGKEHVGFSLQHGGVYHLQGLHWTIHDPAGKPVHSDDRGYGSKFVSFVLEAPVHGVACDLDYSPIFPGSDATGLSQLMCIPHGEFHAEYHFNVSVTVHVTNDDVHVRRVEVDPKIVVSPPVQPTGVNALTR